MRRSCTPVHLVYARYICCYAALPFCPLPYNGRGGRTRTCKSRCPNHIALKLAVCIYGTRGGIRTHTWSFIRTLVWTVGVLSYIGWKDGTWTHDLLIPNQALYQTALLPNMIVTDNSLPSLNDRHYSVPFAVIEYSRSHHPCGIPFRSACLRHFFRRRKLFSLSRL